MKKMKGTTAAYALSRIAVYRTSSQHPFNIVISRGSVVDFSSWPSGSTSAIVNAANEGCLGGGGVDGAISNAGGSNLFADRQNLPEVSPGIRCKTGSAVITGPNDYGKLHTSYVIHAVGPNYMQYATKLDEGDALLSSAYTSSLDCAKNVNLEAVGFSLLSAGIFRGPRSVKEVLRIGMEAISTYHGYSELQEVHMCAFNQKEADVLVEIAKDLGLKKVSDGKCDVL